MDFQTEANICTTCPDNCIACSSETVCTECADREGVYYNSYTKLCTTVCSADAGMVLDTAGKMCKRCTLNCNVCHQSLKQYNGNCYPNCPAGTAVIVDTNMCEISFIAGITANTNSDGSVDPSKDLVITVEASKGSRDAATIEWQVVPALASQILLANVNKDGWTLTLPSLNMQSYGVG